MQKLLAYFADLFLSIFEAVLISSLNFVTALFIHNKFSK